MKEKLNVAEFKDTLIRALDEIDLCKKTMRTIPCKDLKEKLSKILNDFTQLKRAMWEKDVEFIRNNLVIFTELKRLCICVKRGISTIDNNTISDKEKPHSIKNELNEAYSVIEDILFTLNTSI